MVLQVCVPWIMVDDRSTLWLRERDMGVMILVVVQCRDFEQARQPANEATDADARVARWWRLQVWSAPTRVRFPVGIEAGAAPGFSPKFDLQVLDVYAWSHNGSTTCPSSAEPMGLCRFLEGRVVCV